MFQTTVSGLAALFSKFFAASDKDTVLAAIQAETERVIFIDTPATFYLVSTVEVLLSRGFEAETVGNTLQLSDMPAIFPWPVYQPIETGWG